MDTKSLVTMVILSSICSIGLLFQVIQVTNSYLEYRIRRVIIRDFAFNIIPPGVSLCFDLSEVIPDDIVQKFGASGQSSRDIFDTSDQNSDDEPSWWKKFYRFLEVAPLATLFNVTPSVEETLKESYGCAIRFPTEYTMSFMDRSDCYGYLKVEKYIQRQLICYKFTPQDNGQNFDTPKNNGQNFDTRENNGQNFDTLENNGQNFDTRENNGQNFDTRENNGQNFDTREKNGQNFDTSKNGQNFDTIQKSDLKNRSMSRGWIMEYLLAPVNVGTLYELYLNTSAFDRVRRVVAFVHGTDTDHFEDSLITAQHPITISDLKGSTVSISFKELKFKRLESPYPGRCIKMLNGTSIANKFVSLLNKETIETFNKTCAFKQLYEHAWYTNYTVISEADFADEDFRKNFLKIISRYDSYYNGLTCDLIIYLTSVSTQSFQSSNGSNYRLLFYVSWPLTHNIEMIDEPLQTILDYLIYIGSSLGFWFGFNFLTIVSKINSSFWSLFTSIKIASELKNEKIFGENSVKSDMKNSKKSDKEIDTKIDPIRNEDSIERMVKKSHQEESIERMVKKSHQEESIERMVKKSHQELIERMVKKSHQELTMVIKSLKKSDKINRQNIQGLMAQIRKTEEKMNILTK